MSRRGWSLRLRLTGIAAAGAAVVLALGGVVMYGVLTSRLDAALSTELGVRASDVEAELASGDVVSFGGPLRTQVLDARGSVLTPVGSEALVTPEQAAGVAAQSVYDAAGERFLVRRVMAPAGDLLVVVAGSTSSVDQARDQLLRVMAAAGPLVLVGVTVTAWVLTGAALAPVRSMTRRARSISVANPGERLPEPGGDDEIAELAETLNRMLDRITESVQHERSFIDNASHELRTPLAVLRGELELLGNELRASDLVDDDLADGVASAMEETDRLTRLAEQLLALARIDAGEATPMVGVGTCDLTAVASQVAARLEEFASGSGIDVRPEFDGSWRVTTDLDGCERIVTNLVGNAIRYASSLVVVSVSLVDSGVRLLVADDGDGFAEAILARPFERFLRADPERKGTGLGLAIVAALAVAAGGTATLGNGGPVGGAWVQVDLPTAESAGSHRSLIDGSARSSDASDRTPG